MAVLEPDSWTYRVRYVYSGQGRGRMMHDGRGWPGMAGSDKGRWGTGRWGTVENNRHGGSDGEDFTQLSETGEVEMKIMIDCDNLMERKDLRKIVYRKKGALQERLRKKTKGVKTFSRLARPLTTATYTMGGPECGHLLLQVWPLGKGVEKYEIIELYTGNLRESEICLRTTFYLRDREDQVWMQQNKNIYTGWKRNPR